jgi:hypothetical protein
MFHETTSSRGFLENRAGSSAPAVRHIGLTTLHKSTVFFRLSPLRCGFAWAETGNVLEFRQKFSRVC